MVCFSIFFFVVVGTLVVISTLASSSIRYLLFVEPYAISRSLYLVSTPSTNA